MTDTLLSPSIRKDRLVNWQDALHARYCLPYGQWIQGTLCSTYSPELKRISCKMQHPFSLFKWPFQILLQH